MKEILPPRYLRVAHWLCEQRGWMSSREVAGVFGVSPKSICDDFASIRSRPDLFEINERKAKCRGGEHYLIQVTTVHPYVLDSRRSPHRKGHQRPTTLRDSPITWRDLLTCSWHRLDLSKKREMRTDT